MQTADFILSCDWGTSSFRLRLVCVGSREVVAETRAAPGISALYDEWIAARLPGLARRSFYQSALLAAIQSLNHPGILQAPVFISGMASSSIGMEFLDYGQLPLALQTARLPKEYIPASTAFPYDIYLVSGLKTNQDIMRGEETILLGIDAVIEKNCIVIFPGTHSKHATVTDHLLVDFVTYMTGEFFDLLANKSILSKSVLVHDGLVREDFCKGVLEGATGNLLQSAFHVRTRQLLHAESSAGNYDYLSGLVIGQELGNLIGFTGRIILVSGEQLTGRYKLAAEVLGLDGRLFVADADKALVNAHCLLHANP